MKTKILLAAFVSTFMIHQSTFAQGALTPPGAPAPTMKSLAQIEPRTPISAAPYFILTPGSYYLTGNLTVSNSGAIGIFTNNVALDLNGFTISSTTASAVSSAFSAILLNGQCVNVSIYNGHISSGATNTAGGYGGSGFASGILGTSVANVRVKDVSIFGVLSNGIYISTANSSVVVSCTVNVAGRYGIVADSVSNSGAQNCGLTGIYAGNASNCTGSSGGNGDGIDASIANNCNGSSVSGIGLHAFDVATGCAGYSSSGTGLSAFIANCCRGTTGLFGTTSSLSVTHNVNSF